MHLLRGAWLAEEIGDQAGRADALCNLGLDYSGVIAPAAEDLPAAMGALNRSLSIAQDLNDTGLAAMCHSYQALVHSEAGEHEGVIRSAGAALTLRRDLELDLLTTIDLTSLGLAHYALGDMDAALSHIQQALTILDQCQGKGPEFPQRDYHLCSQVLRAAGLTTQAQVALRQAYSLVMDKADRISDPALRCSFLEQVRFNREIVDAYRASDTAA